LESFNINQQQQLHGLPAAANSWRGLLLRCLEVHGMIRRLDEAEVGSAGKQPMEE